MFKQINKPAFPTTPLKEMSSMRGQRDYQTFLNQPQNVNDTAPIKAWMAAKLVLEGNISKAQKSIYRIDMGNDKKSINASGEGLELAIHFLEDKVEANRAVARSIASKKGGKSEGEIRKIDAVLFSLNSHLKSLLKLYENMVSVLEHHENFSNYQVKSKMVSNRINEFLHPK